MRERRFLRAHFASAFHSALFARIMAAQEIIKPEQGKDSGWAGLNWASSRVCLAEKGQSEISRGKANGGGDRKVIGD